LIEQLKKIIPEENIYFNEPMDKHTTFRVGGQASYFLRITKEEEITNLVKSLYQSNTPYFILGNGSNLLVSDYGYEGVMVYIGDGFSDIRREGTRLIVDAGAYLSKVSKFAMEAGLGGLEFASGIPGTIGGGVVMNAGAYDGDMGQVVESIRAIDETGQLITIDRAGMEFDYRTSLAKKKHLVITQVTLRLVSREKEEIRAKMNEFSALRKEKQPLEYPSAGSTFKRPEGYYAGKLIMDAGLKGYQIGGAQISEKHAGFLINRGSATADDIAKVIQKTQEIVLQDSGIVLEPEIIYVGKFEMETKG
ncbi:MAG: UDP-N-acetylmuramate dehydrogenase, partial [Eubacteriales bacterium]